MGTWRRWWCRLTNGHFWYEAIHLDPEDGRRLFSIQKCRRCGAVEVA